MGIIISYLASKIKLPDILLLILSGILLGLMNIKINKFVPTEVLAAFATFALIMIIFDSTKELKFKEIKELSPLSLKLALIFFISIIALLPLPAYVLFTKGSYLISSLLLALFFSLLMGGTSPAVVLELFGKTKNKFLEILEFESIINTPLTVIFPILVFNFYVGKTPDWSYLLLFLQQIIIGIGIGIALGYLFCRILSWLATEKISPLLIVSLALLIYVISENLKGNGVLALTLFGIIYGKSHIREKIELTKFMDLFTTFLKIIVFILLGLMIDLSYYNKFFIIKALILFIIYLLIRFISIYITFYRTEVSLKEKIFLSLNAAKGIGEGVIVLIIGSYNLPSLGEIIQLVLLFILLTIAASIISVKLSKYLMKFKEEERKTLKRIKTKKNLKIKDS